MNNRLVVTAWVAVLGVFAFAGCATFEKGSRQNVTVRSEPSAAEVTVNGKLIGQTPLVVSLPRRGAYSLELRKEGFRPAAASLLPSSSTYDQRWLRWGVDYATGATNDLLPGDLVVKLRPHLLSRDLQTDPFTEMSRNVVQADELLATGRISARDHRYVVAQIIDFYSR